MQPRVSVVIPTYNRGASIGRAIDSALAQSVPVEIIVVDDGSTDDTAERLRRYGDRIRVITQTNQGVAPARNRGVAEARGEFVAFLDSDDEWLPHKLERQLALMDANPEVALVAAAVEYVDDRGMVRNVGRANLSGDIVDSLLFENSIATSTVLVRKRVLDRLDVLFESRITASEDWGVWLRIAVHDAIIVSPEVMVRYHISADGLTSSLPLDHYEHVCREVYDAPGDPLLAEAIARNRRALDANMHFYSAVIAYEQNRPWRARRALFRAITNTPRRLKWTAVLRIAFLTPRIAQWIRDLRRRLHAITSRRRQTRS